MTKDLINSFKVHRQAIATKRFYKQLALTQQQLLTKYPQYLFHKSYYLNNTMPITVLCRSHGFFKQSPKNLLKNLNCPTCKALEAKRLTYYYKDIKYSLLSFREACSSINNYNYSQTNFNGFNKTIYFFCSYHRYVKLKKPHLCLSPTFICPKCRGSSRIN